MNAHKEPKELKEPWVRRDTYWALTLNRVTEER